MKIKGKNLSVKNLEARVKAKKEANDGVIFRPSRVLKRWVKKAFAWLHDKLAKIEDKILVGLTKWGEKADIKLNVRHGAVLTEIVEDIIDIE